MQLTMRDVSAMFLVTEETVERWVGQLKLPAHQVSGRWRFNRFELFEWAIAHQIKVENDSDNDRSKDSVSLTEALQDGGIHYNIAGDTQEESLRAVVRLLPLPRDFDRESLLRLFLAREALGSTGVGDGIAIPHARLPIVLNVARPKATLCFLKRPISYRAPDGKPVRVLFSVISPTVASHVRFLARLSLALQDTGFRNAVVAMKPRQALLRELRRVEKAEQSAGGSNPHAA